MSTKTAPLRFYCFQQNIDNDLDFLKMIVWVRSILPRQHYSNHSQIISDTFATACFMETVFKKIICMNMKLKSYQIVVPHYFTNNKLFKIQYLCIVLPFQNCMYHFKIIFFSQWFRGLTPPLPSDYYWSNHKKILFWRTLCHNSYCYFLYKRCIHGNQPKMAFFDNEWFDLKYP